MNINQKINFKVQKRVSRGYSEVCKNLFCSPRHDGKCYAEEAVAFCFCFFRRRRRRRKKEKKVPYIQG